MSGSAGVTGASLSLLHATSTRKSPARQARGFDVLILKWLKEKRRQHKYTVFCQFDKLQVIDAVADMSLIDIPEEEVMAFTDERELEPVQEAAGEVNYDDYIKPLSCRQMP